MIHREGRHKVTIECDACGDLYEAEGVHDDIEFRLMFEGARRQGWKAQKVGTDWSHWCTGCWKKQSTARRMFASR